MTCRCADALARSAEQELRRTVYLRRHMPTDIVVDPAYYSTHAYSDTGFCVDARAVRAFDDGLSVTNNN